MKNNKIKSFRNKNTMQLYALCAIPMLLFFVFCYLPMFGIVIAFKDYRFDKGIWGSDWVGLKNFAFFVQSNDFARITRNTILLNMLFIVSEVVVSMLIAIMLFHLTKRLYVKVYQTVLISPYYLSWVVVGYMSFAFLSPEYGYINSVLRSVGFTPVAWYSKPGYWPVILTVASIWKSAGINSVIYYAVLMGIDTGYFEAATIDGAKKSDMIRYIIIPHLVPMVTILMIMSVGNIFRADFGLFYQLTRDVGALYSTTDVLDTYIYRVMRRVGDMSISSAAGVMQSFVGFMFIMLINHTVKKIEPDNALF